MGFSRQEYRNGLPCPPPGDLLNPGIECTAPATPALDFFFTAEPPVKLSMEGWILAIPLRLLVPLMSEQEIMFIVMS